MFLKILKTEIAKTDPKVLIKTSGFVKFVEKYQYTRWFCGTRIEK